jgi:cell division septation protein DedD
MKRRVLALGVSLLILGLMPGFSLAAAKPVVDQESLAATRASALNGSYVQTFKVGKAGSLTGVDLWLSHSGTISVTVNIERIIGVVAAHPAGHPDGKSLAKKVVAVGAADAWVHFALTPFNVTKGELLAIVFTAGCSVRWSTANRYTSGYALIGWSPWSYLQGSSRADFAFRTYVGPAVAVKASATAQGSATPTPTAVPIETPTPTPVPLPTPSATPEPTPTASPAPAASSGSGWADGWPVPIEAILMAVVLAIAGTWFFFDRRRHRPKG